MRLWLSLLLSLLALTASASPGQPYFVKPTTNERSDLRAIPGLAYWWVASDLTNSPVSNWVDRIQGIAFAAAANKPTWSSNHVTFDGHQWLSISSPVPVRCDGNATDAYLLAIFAQRQTSGGGVIVGTSNATATKLYMGMQYPNLRWGLADVATPPTNTIMDYLYVGSKASLPRGQYTNGVFASWQVQPTLNNGVATLGNRVGGPDGSGFTFVGDIYEVAIWTNSTGDTMTTNWIAQAHAYATNTYKFAP